MRLQIDSAAARLYGLHGATVLAYLRWCEVNNPTQDGWFSAPHLPLQYNFKITRAPFDRLRDKLERDHLIKTNRLSYITLYQLDHQMIDALTGQGDK